MIEWEFFFFLEYLFKWLHEEDVQGQVNLMISFAMKNE